MKLELAHDNVNVWGLRLPMQIALKYVEEVWKQHGQTKIVVTSARDGIHAPGSLHYYGLAIDLRIWAFGEIEQKQIVAELREKLDGFDVILETNHIHIEAQWVLDSIVTSWKQWQ